MPLYEYQCQACGHRFEKIQKFSDPIEDVCPACGGKVDKLLSSPAIQFKGSGWYITDYAKKGGGDGAKPAAGGDAAAKPDSSSETKTTETKESKPAAPKSE